MLNMNCTKYAPGFLSLHLTHNYIYNKFLYLKHGTVRKYGRTQTGNLREIQLNPGHCI
jgi:hypothetical protein